MLLTLIALYATIDIILIVQDYNTVLIMIPSIFSLMVLVFGCHSLYSINPFNLTRIFMMLVIGQWFLDLVLMVLFLHGGGFNTYLQNRLGLGGTIDYGRISYYLANLVYSITTLQILLLLFTVTKASNHKPSFGSAMLILLLFVALGLTTCVVADSVHSTYFNIFVEKVIKILSNNSSIDHVVEAGSIAVFYIILAFKLVLSVLIVLGINLYRKTLPVPDEEEPQKVDDNKEEQGVEKKPWWKRFQKAKESQEKEVEVEAKPKWWNKFRLKKEQQTS